jgi:carboxypeptidase Taq
VSKADAYPALVAHFRDLTVLQSCSAVLGWDQQTYMPRGGAGFRGEQLALLAKLCHERATDPRIEGWLTTAEVAPDSAEAANVREWRHGYDRATKLPARLVEELALATSAAHEAWEEARREDKFETFRPHLEKVLGLKREEAEALSPSPPTPTEDPRSRVGLTRGRGERYYDALLDEYEPGTTAAELKTLFAELTSALVPLIRRITDGPPADTSCLRREFAVDRQKWFAEGAAEAIGFDFTAGRLDKTAHPFCSAFGPGDCRLTTRYNPRVFNEAFFGVLHEAGHGMYEQGLPAEAFGTPCGTFCSLGLHESQSRLWENQVGRSPEFWRHWFPRLKQAFPGVLTDVTADGFVKAINSVSPSLIRVEADEATYNLHIAIRFELEVALLGGDLSVADLPGAWNDAYEKSLGVRPPSDATGCLQDIHWSFGGFGYFPTYTLGNLLAAQLLGAARAALPDLNTLFATGDYAPLLGWLREHIHRHGRRFRAAELCRRATAQPLSAKPFLDYLSGKFGTTGPVS